MSHRLTLLVIVCAILLPSPRLVLARDAANKPKPRPAKAVDPNLVIELHDAICRGQVDRVKAMLKDHHDLATMRIPSGQSLPARVAEKRKWFRAGHTPLHIVAARNRKLLRRHAGYEMVEAWTPQYQAQLLEIAKMLLAAGADVNATTPYASTPLSLAITRQARCGWAGMAKLLLDANAECDLPSPGSSETPLAMAIRPPIQPEYWGGEHQETRLAVIKALLAHGANPCRPTWSEMLWPYEFAVKIKQSKIAEALREPTRTRAKTEYAAIQDVVARWAQATRTKDNATIASLTADDPDFISPPSDWTEKTKALRQAYADDPNALGRIISRRWHEPWAVVQTAGDRKGTSLVLNLMRFPDGRWRLYKAKQVNSDANNLARKYLRNCIRNGYRNTVLDAAGMLPIPPESLPPNQMKTNGEFPGYEVFVRNGRLVLKSPQSTHRYEVDKHWVKSWHNKYHLQISTGIEAVWIPDEGKITFLDIAKGRAVLTKHDEEIILEPDGSNVRAISGGKTTVTAKRILVNGATFSVAPAPTKTKR